MSNERTEFPTSGVETTVGSIRVSDKRYAIDGELVDAKDDTPIDVNSFTDVTVASRGCRSAFNLPKTETSNATGGSFQQENARQTLTDPADDPADDQT